MLKDVDNAAQLKPLKRKACGCRDFSFRRHLGDGYYVTAIYHKHILEFRQHYHGEEIRTIYASKKGISINLQDQWNDFLNNIIPSIHHHYPKFDNVQPQCGCLYDNEGRHLGWKACTVCYPFGRDINLKAATNALLLKNSQQPTNTIANTKATDCSRRWRLRRIFWLIWSSSYCWIWPLYE